MCLVLVCWYIFHTIDVPSASLVMTDSEKGKHNYLLMTEILSEMVLY